MERGNMHGCVFVIRDPETEKNMIDDCEIFEMMSKSGSGCDYVVPMDETTQAEAATNILGEFGETIGKFYVLDLEKATQFMEERLETFKAKVKSLSINEFVKGFERYRIKALFDPKDVYVCMDYYTLLTFDEFLASAIEMRQTQWIVDSVFDYHI